MTEKALEVARLSHAEIACYEMYDQIDEVFCSLVVLKAFLNSDDYTNFMQ